MFERVITDREMNDKQKAATTNDQLSSINDFLKQSPDRRSTNMYSSGLAGLSAFVLKIKFYII